MKKFNVTLTPSEKISKAKVRLYRESPFFSYLVEHMRTIEAGEDFRFPVPTCAVDNRGRFYFNPDFVSQLSDDETIGVLSHEVLHLAFNHPKRVGRRTITLTMPDGNTISLWNIAIDIVVNNVVTQNGLSLPKEAICPKDNTIEIFGVSVNDIENKSAEEIYEELKVSLREQAGKQGKNKGQGQGTGSGNIGVGDPNNELGFDEHRFEEDGEGKEDAGAEKNGKNSIPSEGKAKEVDWSRKMAEAYNYAKQRGVEPSGVGREYEILGKSMVNWRAILRREIGKKIPVDYTWRKPNKKYLSQDIYMPATIGEDVKVLVGIDTSGSISTKELSEFMTEVISISKTFSSVEFRVITHDAKVHDDILCANGNIQKLKELPLHGGGGTDHNPLYEHIKEQKYDKRYNLLVSFTDGYSSYPEKPCVDSFFVLSGDHCGKAQMPSWGKCLELQSNG